MNEAEKAWNLAREIAMVGKDGGAMSNNEFERIFPQMSKQDVFALRYSEANGMIETYKKTIRVGDLVRLKNSCIGVVLSIRDNGCTFYCVLTLYGVLWYGLYELEKIGASTKLNDLIRELEKYNDENC